MANAPITDLRVTVKAIVTNVFGAEFVVKDGKLNNAHPGQVVGIYPIQEVEGRRVLDQDSAIVVQFFLPWTAQVRPDYVADPAAIEAVVERFREGFYAATHPRAGTAGVWDLRVVRAEYLEDPIGQITRAQVTVVGIGQNFAETVG